MCTGLYFLLDAFVHKVKSDFIRHQKTRDQQKSRPGTGLTKFLTEHKVYSAYQKEETHGISPVEWFFRSLYRKKPNTIRVITSCSILSWKPDSPLA